MCLDFAEKHEVPVDRFAGTKKWPAYNLYPKNPWNYALVLNKDNPTENFEVKLKEWPETNTPFKLEDVPLWRVTNELKELNPDTPTHKIQPEQGLNVPNYSDSYRNNK